MKVLERLVESLIRQRVEIDEMQCRFMSGSGTTNAIFIVRHLVGNAENLSRRVAGVLGPVHVQGREKQGKSRRWIQQGVWYWSRCSSGPCSQPASLHHCFRGSI